MPGQIPSHIKSARGKEMRTLAKDLEQRFLQSQVGKIMPVLFESKAHELSNTEDLDIWQGHTANYCLCQIKAQSLSLANTLKYVQITGVTNDRLIGNLHSDIQ